MGIDYVKMRRAQRRDRESIRRVLAESIREAAASEYAHDKDLSKYWFSRAAESVDQAIGNPDFQVLVAEDSSGGIVGVGTLHNEGEIKQCYVTRKAWRKGVGRRILTELEEHAKRIGLKELRLNSSVGARSFYQRNGFHISGEPFMWGGVIKVYPMRKQLR
jgi:GNAT superfamily N-acetyltransferase